ncbi:MAG: UDP-N-acetylmuramate dehydrogenase [Clostridia bacterium]|nr:UDP-N-acetylmuramate dehydrogenase [Clostridia bacterium]
MRDYTTLKLGGPADWLALPASREEIAGLMREARSREIPVTILGHGSNVLVLDGGIRGLVIRMGRGMNRVEVRGREIIAQTGAMMGTVASAAAEHGLTGLEFASGIPGTVGGGVLMNAGAYGGEMAQVVSSVAGVTPDGGFLTLEGDALGFGYRRSAMQENGLVISEVRFRLEEGDPRVIRETMADLNRRRAESQPLDVPSAGSTFKRPEGAYAAALIDQCGLKGYAIGGARVSPKHAGFLVNTGERARDFLDLMRAVQRIVEERTGIRLEPEIRILGEDEA